MSKGKLKNIHPFLIRARLTLTLTTGFGNSAVLQKRMKEKRKGGRKEKARAVRAPGHLLAFFMALGL